MEIPYKANILALDQGLVVAVVMLGCAGGPDAEGSAGELRGERMRDVA